MKTVIQSPSNDKVKKFLAQQEDFYIFEGKKLVNDIISREIEIEKLVILNGAEGEWPASRKNIKEVWHVGERVMKKLSSLKSPTTHLLTLKIAPKPECLTSCQTFLILDNIQDPGNVGSVFRCAAAFGFEAIVLTGETVNPNNGKLIRTAQLSLLDIPFIQFRSLDQCIDALPEGINIYLTSPDRSQRHMVPLEKLKQPLALVFGNEGSGLDISFLNRYPTITIPQSEKIDSLNVAISACILMFLITQK
jgi:TrmH family RNA methyltransferase